MSYEFPVFFKLNLSCFICKSQLFVYLQQFQAFVMNTHWLRLMFMWFHVNVWMMQLVFWCKMSQSVFVSQVSKGNIVKLWKTLVWYPDVILVHVFQLMESISNVYVNQDTQVCLEIKMFLILMINYDFSTPWTFQDLYAISHWTANVLPMLNV